MSQSFKTEIKPTKKQEKLLRQHIGAARWAYNFGLDKKINAYKATGKSPSAVDLHKEVVKLKQTKDYSWLKDLSKCAPQMALRNLDVAFNNFFRRCKAGAARKGHPKFKSKHSSKQSFRLDGAIHVFDNKIQLPRLGKIKLKEHSYLPTSGRVMSATVSHQSNRWFVSINIDKPEPQLSFNQTDAIGIDLGLTSIATLNTGFKLDNPRTLRKYEERLKFLQRQTSRKKKGSANRRKAIQRLQKLWFRIQCIRKDFIHKFTTTITKRYKLIGIEDLSIQNMMKWRNLSKSLGDACLHEIIRQLKYKAKWYGCTIVQAGKFFPSSKLCSNCNNKKQELKLSDRIYDCGACGMSLDRDINAAINLKNLAIGKTAGSSPVAACGAAALAAP